MKRRTRISLIGLFIVMLILSFSQLSYNQVVTDDIHLGFWGVWDSTQWARAISDTDAFGDTLLCTEFE